MEYIISISDFNEIVNGIKALKSDLVCVYGRYLIGIDNSMTILKTFEMSKEMPIPPITIISKALSKEFFANITDTVIVIDMSYCSIYCPNNKDTMNSIILAPEYTDIIMNKFNNINNNCHNYLNKVYFGDITNNQEFERVKELKASDGARLFIPDNYHIYSMYLFSGIITANKQDKVYLTIYDNGNTFVGNFTVEKKKAGLVNIFINFKKLY